MPVKLWNEERWHISVTRCSILQHVRDQGKGEHNISCPCITWECFCSCSEWMWDSVINNSCHLAFQVFLRMSWRRLMGYKPAMQQSRAIARQRLTGRGNWGWGRVSVFLLNTVWRKEWGSIFRQKLAILKGGINFEFATSRVSCRSGFFPDPNYRKPITLKFNRYALNDNWLNSSRSSLRNRRVTRKGWCPTRDAAAPTVFKSEKSQRSS